MGSRVKLLASFADWQVAVSARAHAESTADPYKWGYYGQELRDRERDAADAFLSAVEALIDERVASALEKAKG